MSLMHLVVYGMEQDPVDEFYIGSDIFYITYRVVIFHRKIDNFYYELTINSDTISLLKRDLGIGNGHWKMGYINDTNLINYLLGKLSDNLVLGKPINHREYSYTTKDNTVYLEIDLTPIERIKRNKQLCAVFNIPSMDKVLVVETNPDTKEYRIFIEPSSQRNCVVLGSSDIEKKLLKEILGHEVEISTKKIYRVGEQNGSQRFYQKI